MLGAFRDAAGELLAAFGQPGVLEQVATVPIGTVPGLAALPAGRSPFGPPQPVATDAPAIDRLAACLGRAVTTGGRSEGRS
jgi:hypothetical protein